MAAETDRIDQFPDIDVGGLTIPFSERTLPINRIINDSFTWSQENGGISVRALGSAESRKPGENKLIVEVAVSHNVPIAASAGYLTMRAQVDMEYPPPPDQQAAYEALILRHTTGAVDMFRQNFPEIGVSE